jgi:hypothetical protein
MLYFLFQELAFCAPAEICSWWRSRKLFAVLAADFASERETEDGSSLKDWAVLRAACFWARVVPLFVALAGASGGEVGVGLELEFMREKRDWSSFIFKVGGDVAWAPSDAVLLSLLPMPRPGTDIPASPNLFEASWLMYVLPIGFGSSTTESYVGGGGLLATGDARLEELLRGGSLGGRDGFDLGGA